MKKTLIVGNWKMHLNTQQASLLVRRLGERVPQHRDIETVLAPSMLTLQPISLEVDRRKFRLAAQNANAQALGALTGEVSFAMLSGLVHYGIIGHSERRKYFAETNKDVRAKVAAAVRNEITPIICVGETRVERTNHETKQVVREQVVTALRDLTGPEVAEVVIAYEPVWAIGAGRPASAAAIAESVAYIRLIVEGQFGKKVADSVRILYGGSVEPDYVTNILSIDNVDGFLVGGASLNYQQFAQIVSKAHALEAAKEKDAK